LRDAGTSGERCTLARALRDGAPLHQLRALAGSAITLVADAERARATLLSMRIPTDSNEAY